MSKFSKGKWKIQRYHNYCGWAVYAEGVGCIAQRWYSIDRSEQENEEMKANAHLIASAPDMLAILKKFSLDFESFYKDGVRPDEWLLEEWKRKVDRVLEHAEGEAEGKLEPVLG